MQLKIRVDAGNGMGLGHLIRCLSIAQIVRGENINPEFYLIKTDLSVKKIIEDEGLQCRILDNNESFLDLLTTTDLVILDGYHFSSEYEYRIKERVRRLITIDDLLARHFYADVILNHTPGIDPEKYSKEPYTRVFTGLKYCLLREALLKSERRTRVPVKLVKCILCLGGEDPDNNTKMILSGILKTDSHFQIDVVVGASYKHQGTLRELASELNNVSIHINIDVLTLVGLIQKADFAVVSASTISLECAYLGIPLYAIKTVENQDSNFNYLTKHRIAYHYSEIGNYTHSAGEIMLASQRAAFSGDIKTNIKNVILNEYD